MAWDIEAFTGAGNAAAAGVFIPVENLPGLLAAELDDDNVERKVAYSLSTLLHTKLSALPNLLGLSVSRPSPSGAAVDRINQQYSLTTQFMVNHASNSVSTIPLPVSNAGRLTLEAALGAGVQIVAAAGAVGAGIVLPNSLVTGFGGVVPGSTDAADARSWLAAVYHGMVTGQDATNAAIVAATVSPAAGISPPANFTGVNAITGIAAVDLPLRSFFSKTYSLTFQLALDQVAQTFDLAA